MRFVRTCLLASATLFIASGANADPTTPPAASTSQKDVATLLFSNPQWAKAPAGTTLTYAYEKIATKPEFGPPFKDKIVLKLEPGEAPDRRTADVTMFSGSNARAAGPFRSEEQNPILLLALEQNVQELSHLFKANPRYLKNAIRKAWREKAKIVDMPIDLNGKQVPGTRITITPFAGDSESSKMMDLDGLVYTVDISGEAPGTIAAIDIRAPAEGKPIFAETLRFAGAEKTADAKQGDAKQSDAKQGDAK